MLGGTSTHSRRKELDIEVCAPGLGEHAHLPQRAGHFHSLPWRLDLSLTAAQHTMKIKLSILPH